MKQFEVREISKGEHFDPSTLCDLVPFTQAGFYGEWQKNLGRKVRRFLVYRDSAVVAYFQLIKYPLLFGKSYFYIPYGPVTKEVSEKFFIDLKSELLRIAATENIVFIRLDFTPFVSKDILSKFFAEAPPYTYHSAYFQPRAEWFLGLEKSESELLAGMHEKTRYSVRLAERKGVTAEIITENFEAYFEIFYAMILETGQRNGFGIHEKSYYESIFQNLPEGNAYLSVAKYGDKVLAINLVIIFGKIANYVFGGSSSEERNRMPTYLAHWKAICQAKKMNSVFYNFGAVTSESETHKGWDGITLFKKKFGGNEIRHSDFFDVVMSPFWYHLYNLRKRLKQIRH